MKRKWLVTDVTLVGSPVNRYPAPGIYRTISNQKTCVSYNTRKIARPATALAQQCPSCVASPGPVFKPWAPIQWDVMCLLDGVFVGVQAPRWVVHQ